MILDFPAQIGPSLVYTETATDSLFVQDAASVQRFVTIFANLNSAAHRAPRTLRFIREIMESEHQCDD
ncbi:Scr1 family TA system antitoxin-like transcriptional regulator [Streptomonospora wellingtoniae]|uniref:Scr1 family TA system antitoxin-like transcriptional regulator n=1 Tax=Streptomonospora wellingtoniae TaxID=3075544 RepID=A0ABU2KRF0_9ACTN|nr:Scr1 family TA system antitoxin-like transcriptional regulator [Streptomonospora sp. DSM 45055]MDT0301796.1 Scr1 family TA system antitoxin-like transcriptional regulator [Streptomonospora sp. DSM 45055]